MARQPAPSERIAYTNANIWQEWFPESALADVLAGDEVVPDIGQVKGAWKRALEKEVRAGRLAKWRGHWFPNAGAPWGMGPLKTCYGTPQLSEHFAAMRAGTVSYVERGIPVASVA